MFEYSVGGGASLLALEYSPRIDFGRLMSAGRRARQAMFFVMLLSLATYCSVVSCKIEEPTKVIQTERMQIEANHGKEGSESVGIFSRNPRSAMDTTAGHKITIPSDEEKTNEHGVQQPKEDDHHQCGIMDKEDFSIYNKAKPEVMQPAAVPIQMWKTLEFPSDHVLLFQCSGDELTVRIRPRLDGFEEYYVRLSSGHLSSVCANRVEMPSLYDAYPDYHALFWMLPEEEDLVPVPPTELSETTLTEEETPENFTFRTDVVVFYQSKTMNAKTKIHIVAREAVEFRHATGEKPGTVSPFSPYSIIFWKNAPYTPHRTYVAF